MTEPLFGYAGQLLRVDLSQGQVYKQALTADFARTWVGGTGFGAKILYDEVPAEIQWDDPANRVIVAAGPLAGTKVHGSGTFALTFKGPMTNLAGSSQASGFLAAFLKFSGFDAAIIEGAAPHWCYLYIHDGQAELRDARGLLGKDTWETGAAIAEELGVKENRLSVYSIGPAGENLVRFAAVVGDKGHVAAHNGGGAVWGAKKLKAIAVLRGSQQVPVHDPARLAEAAERIFEHGATKLSGGIIYNFGTGGLLPGTYASGSLPVKNYTTNIFPEYETTTGQYMRTHFEIHPHPCYACRLIHVKMVKVTEGPYAGFEGEEPEYESLAAWGAQIGQSDAGAVVFLSDLTDRLGLDVNESSWLTGWLMECLEKGLLSKNDVDGLDLTWGNVPAVAELLRKMATRQGCGSWLAEGVMRASARIGGEAPNLGVYTLKGASPRSHDHRGRWTELFDTVLSNTGTIQDSFGLPPAIPGAPALVDRFSPEQVVNVNAKTGGWRQFEDCLGVCRFCLSEPVAVMDCFQAVTGWPVDTNGAVEIGGRIINQLRAFSIRHGVTPEMEVPSPRYGSTPVDGPAEGKNISAHFKEMRRDYWEKMGWDPERGKPLPETLKALGLDALIADLWPHNVPAR
jgi:aldehyde:ferredoxin oxidoreductase